MNRTFFILSTSIVFFISCSNPAKTNPEEKASGEAQKIESSTNYLTMKIDGIEWKAEREIFGAFHPKGYDNAIIISGSKGPNNKDEQDFTLNIFNTNGPSTFEIKTGNGDMSVVQLANMSPEHFMYGSMMGFNVKVIVTKASNNPTVVEATFEGELTGNSSDKIKITEGKFYYHE